jgi:hypothetical protein
MPKFEYSTLVFDTTKLFAGPKLNHDEFHSRLNKYGQEGWELVNVFDVTRQEGMTIEIVAVFKRQLC